MPNTDLALQADDIQKQFGHFTALAGITMEVRRGEFIALFGRNGAGKTTFMKIAATLMRATTGSLRICGLSIDDDAEKARSMIGFLSHNTYLYRDLSPVENLRFFGRLYAVPDLEQRIHPLLDRVGLKRRAADPVRSFSRGLQQRLGIARAFLHDPSVILLDEPYTGLDAGAIEMLHALLDEAIRRGSTIILTTHDLEQGLRAAHRAAIIDRGKLVYFDAARNAAVRSAFAEHVQMEKSR
jgi:heme ABC exporter ATP-binding subunit CcmA